MNRTQLLTTLMILVCIALAFGLSIILISPLAPNSELPTLASLDQQPPISHALVNMPSIQTIDESYLQTGQELIVQFQTEPDATTLSQLEATLEVEFIEDASHIDSYLVRITEPLDEDQLQSFAPNIIIEPNYRVESLLTYPTNDPMLPQQWAFDVLNISTLWQTLEVNSPRIVVAVIDSGVCFDHPDLQGQFLNNGYDFIDDDVNPADQMGHGCAISGILAGKTHNGIGIAGIAPNVDILPIRVLDENGVGTYADVASAIYYAVDQGASIINLSLGGKYASQILQQAVNYATQRGVDVIAGAGNSGQNGVYYPARYPNVIAVGSINEAGQQSTFSTTGIEVNTLAPGENILSTTLDGGYGTFSGTSMAVPHVSALYALSRSTGQPINLTQIVATPPPSQSDTGQVQALEPTFTPSPTPEIEFSCSMISVAGITFRDNNLFLDIDYDFAYATHLKEIRVEWSPVNYYPSMYLSMIAVDTNVIFSGNGSSPTVVTSSQFPHPSNGRIASNDDGIILIQFVDGPPQIEPYLYENGLEGTKLIFQTVANVLCEIDIPEDINNYVPPPAPSPTADSLPGSPPFPECGNTNIELVNIQPTSIIYEVTGGNPATDYIVNMDHTNTVMGGYGVHSVRYKGNLIKPEYGSWLSSPYLDNGQIRLYYEVDFPLNESYGPEDFDTAFQVYNTASNSYCTIYATISEPFPDPMACGSTDIYFNALTEDTLSFTVEDVDVAHDVVTMLRQHINNYWAPVSSTLALNEIKIDDHVLWTGWDIPPVSTKNIGNWYPYSAIDGNSITLTYTSSYSLVDYLDIQDFYTYISFENTLDNSPCSDYQTLYVPSNQQPQIDTAEYNDGVVHLSWSLTSGTPTHFIIDTQDIDQPWEELATVTSDITSYTDDTLVCDDYRRFRVRAYDEVSGTYISSPIVYLPIPPCVVMPPTDLTAEQVEDGVQLSWNISGTYTDIEIERFVSDVDTDFELLDIVSQPDTTYLDTIDYVCGDNVTYRLTARLWSNIYGEYYYSDPVTVGFTATSPNCIDLLPPGTVSATREVNGTGIEISWIPANDDQDYFVVYRKIVGQETTFKVLNNLTSLLSHIDKSNYTCDNTEIIYRVISRLEHPELGRRYSAPADISFDYTCPRTDLELEVTTSNPAPEPYVLTPITVTVRNTGDEDAHNLYVRHYITEPYYVINWIASLGSYTYSNATTRTWSFNVLPAHSEHTLILNVLTQQDTITGEQPFVFEIYNTDAIDPDSDWGNNDPTEDDYDSLIINTTCPVSDELFTIANGDSDGFIRAMGLANYETCFPGQDTISLAENGTYLFSKIIVLNEGRNAFAPITSDIVVNGNQATLDAENRDLRTFFVTQNGTLSANQLNIKRFKLGYIFPGTIVLNYGTAILDELNITNNSHNDGTTIYSEGSSGRLELYNSYLGVNSGDFQIFVGEDSSARIENSTIDTYSSTNGSSVEVYGTLDSYFSTYKRDNAAHIRPTGANAVVNVFANAFKGYPSTCSANFPLSKFNSLGYNVSTNCAFGHPTDIGLVENIHLGYAADYGGFTESIKPEAKSPVIDVVPVELCSLNRDQNGAFRPQDSDGDGYAACNAGSFEGEYNGFILASAFDNITPSDNDIITLTVELINETDTDATDISVDFHSIDELQFVDNLGATAGTLSVISGTSRWTMATLPANSAESVQIRYTIDLPTRRVYNSVVSEYSFTHNTGTVEGSGTASVRLGCQPLDYVFNVPANDAYALESALIYANYESCTPGADTITLAPDSLYVIDGEFDLVDSLSISFASLPSMLPSITSEVIIEGNHSTLNPASSAEKRVFYVAPSGSLSLQDITFSDFDMDLTHGFDALVFSYGHLELRGMEFIDNNAPRMVMIFDDMSSFTVENSLFWNNTTTTHYHALGFTSNVDGVIQNSTFGQDEGRPPNNGISGRAGILDMKFNTLVGGGSGYNDEYSLNIPVVAQLNLTGNLLIDSKCHTSNGWIRNYNVLVRTSCSPASSNEGFDPTATLSLLADYGGSIQSVYPEIGSLAIDFVPPQACDVTEDQRGFPRPVNTNCDAGAFENSFPVNAPTDLAASIDYDLHTVTLNWTDNSDNESGFYIRRKGTLESNWSVIGVNSTNDTQFVDSDVLVCDQSYSYSVSAFADGEGFSQMSNIVTGVNAYCEPLVPPVLSVIPISGTVLPDTSVTLSWTDENSGVSTWKIESRIDGGNWTSVSSGLNVQVLNQSLLCESTYEFRVASIRTIDSTQSGWSNIALFNSGDCPPPPIITAISSTKSTQLEVRWEPDNRPNHYVEIFRRPVGSVSEGDWVYVNKKLSSIGAYLDTIPVCNGSYEYRLRNRWEYAPHNHLSGNSDPIAGTAYECINAPTNLTNISSSIASITLSWEINVSQTNYETVVERYDTDNGYWSELTRLPMTETQFTDDEISCISTYDYRVQLYSPDQDEYSPYSNVVHYVVPHCNYQPGPTFTVTTTIDKWGVCTVEECTLRSAVRASNNQAGTNTIILPAGVYDIVIDGISEGEAQRGDYDVRDDLVILGESFTNTIIDVNSIDRAFTVLLGADFTIDNVTLLNSSNETDYAFGGPEGGGLIYALRAGAVVVTNSILKDSYTSNGGAISIVRSESLLIDNVQFLNNSVRLTGGAISTFDTPTIIDNSLFDGNYSLVSAYGGAVYSTTDENGDGRDLSIYRTIFRNNFTSSSFGGAVYATNLVEVRDVIAENNHSTRGGAFHFTNSYDTVVNLSNLTIVNNTSTGSGGGLYLNGNFHISNSTINNNTAETSGGGVWSAEDIFFDHVVITHNSVHNDTYNNGWGGGITVLGALTYTPVMTNSIVAYNSADVSGQDDCVSTILTVQNSIIESANGCGLTLDKYIDSYIGVDPLLAEIQITGDGKYYHSLLVGSPAINNAKDASCSPLDYLGNPRPFGIHCDIGNVESNITLNPPTGLSGTVDGSTIELTWIDNSHHDVAIVVERSLDNINWTEVANLAPDEETYLDTLLSCYTPYYYRVSSRTAIYTAYSNTWDGATDCEPLAITSITTTLISNNSIRITWTESNRNESSFEILRRVTGTWQTIGTTLTDIILFDDTSIDCEVEYDYQVRAHRDLDNVYADSNIVSRVVDTCAHTPSNFATTAVSDEQIDQEWIDESNIESNYVLSRSNDNTNWSVIATLNANSQNYSDTGLLCETTYYYQLQSYIALYNSYSPPVNLTTTTAKCIVAHPGNIAANTQGKLSWTGLPPQQTSQYILERAATENGEVSLLSETPLNWQVKATIPNSITSYTDTDLKCGMTYTYRLQGYNNRYNEYSGYSDEIEIITSECPVPVTHTIGLYQNGIWAFRDGFENADPTVIFAFGPQESGWIPLTGDWDGDGIDGIGIYRNGQFLLRDVSSQGARDYAFYFGATDGTWQPIAGDWNGDGITTVGVYRDGTFQLTNTLRRPQIDYQFYFGPTTSGWRAITGDWNHVGSDRVGLYKNGEFLLHSSFKSGATGTHFIFGPTDGNWIPVAGDWDKDGISTIGIYRENGWRLRNSNSNGAVDHGFSFGPFTGQSYPIASYRGGEEEIELLALYGGAPITTDVSKPTPIPTDEPLIVTDEPTLMPEETAEVIVTEIPPTDEPIPTASLEATPTIEPTATVEPSPTPLPTATMTPIPPTEILPDIPQNVSGSN